MQQLYKLICVQKVQVLSNKNDVERQLPAGQGRRGREGTRGADAAGGYLQGEGAGRDQILMILEITGDNDKITAMMRLLEDTAYWSWFAPAWSRARTRSDEVMSSDIFD